MSGIGGRSYSVNFNETATVFVLEMRWVLGMEMNGVGIWLRPKNPADT